MGLPGLTRALADKRYMGKAATARALAGIPIKPIGTMTTPPTITQDAGQAQGNPGSTGTTLTGTVLNLGYNTTGRWNFLGGPGFTSGAAYYTNGLFASATGTNPTWRIEFMHQGQEFEWIYRATAAAPAAYRIMVDGEWVGAAVSSPGSTGLRYFVKMTFASRGTRRIIIELDQLAWGGINYNQIDSIWAPIPDPPMMFLSDSYGLGTGATRQGSGWAMTLANLLGWKNVVSNAQSGTGYLNPSTSSKQKFEDRIAATVTPYAPRLIVIMGGFNDNTTWNATQVGAAATSLYAALAAALPDTPLIVTSSQSATQVSSSTDPLSTYTRSAAIAAAAAAAPNVKRYIDMTNASPWITGNGRAGATNGSGNADVLISSDAAHPTQEGHDFYAARIAPYVRDFLINAG